MSSGFGIGGGRGRCFTFWQEFAKCHVSSPTSGLNAECTNEFQDYQECLFHKKEFLRLEIVQKEWMRQQLELRQQQADAKAPSAIKAK